MNNLSLYNITSAFPIIMEQEEMSPSLKEELELKRRTLDDINREIDKYLFDIEDSFGIELDTDEMDLIEENIFKTAAKRYYDKLIWKIQYINS